MLSNLLKLSKSSLSSSSSTLLKSNIIRSFSVKEMTVRDALNSAIDEEMERDKNVFIMGEEVGNYQGM